MARMKRILTFSPNVFWLALHHGAFYALVLSGVKVMKILAFSDFEYFVKNTPP